MTNPLLRALITVGCLVGATGCAEGNSTSQGTTIETITPDRTEVFRYETTGGCLMMGPNCATYVVYSDGRTEVYRTGENAPAEVIGLIPEAEVTAFLDSVKGTDFEALADEVGPGTCNACVDGIDIKLTLNLDSTTTALDSTIVNFDVSNSFFANVETLMEDVRAVGELEIQQRG